jgi:hypothetical protein
VDQKSRARQILQLLPDFRTHIIVVRMQPLEMLLKRSASARAMLQNASVPQPSTLNHQPFGGGRFTMADGGNVDKCGTDFAKI